MTGAYLLEAVAGMNYFVNRPTNRCFVERHTERNPMNESPNPSPIPEHG